MDDVFFFFLCAILPGLILGVLVLIWLEEKGIIRLSGPSGGGASSRTSRDSSDWTPSPSTPFRTRPVWELTDEEKEAMGEFLYWWEVERHEEEAERDADPDDFDWDDFF